MSSSLKILATFAVDRTIPSSRTTLATIAITTTTTNTLSVVVAQGSVVGFHVPVGSSRSDSDKRIGAIVNAANEGCLGGAGVDGAITLAGGPTLARDRLALPVLSRTTTARCLTGNAAMTGPGDYGDLNVPFVVHAVGPNYSAYDDFDTPDRLLRSAYQSSLEACRKHDVTDVAFSLLSAGVYRGRRNIKDVLTIGVNAIQEWWAHENHQASSSSAATNGGSSSLKTVTLCGYSEQEVAMLMAICREHLGREEGVEV
jgi:O-acetyl-ADP-ribose deacetylase (regulator of RNase III)